MIKTFELDNSLIEDIVRQEAKKRVESLIIQHTFWDMEELARQTNMSVPFIKEKFFYDPDFPKFKVGSKWLMPAQEAHDFLTKWLKRQSQN